MHILKRFDWRVTSKVTPPQSNISVTESPKSIVTYEPTRYGAKISGDIQDTFVKERILEQEKLLKQQERRRWLMVIITIVATLSGNKLLTWLQHLLSG